MGRTEVLGELGALHLGAGVARNVRVGEHRVEEDTDNGDIDAQVCSLGTIALPGYVRRPGLVTRAKPRKFKHYVRGVSTGLYADVPDDLSKLTV